MKNAVFGIVAAMFVTPAFADHILVPAVVVDVVPKYTMTRVCEENRGDELAGAIVGAIIGSQFGNGNGKTAGAVVGAIIGSNVVDNGHTVCYDYQDGRNAGFVVTYKINGAYYKTDMDWAPEMNSMIYVERQF